MARTKQTARKSTGGKAPRRQLAGSWRPVIHNLEYSKPQSQQRVLPDNPNPMSHETAVPSEAQRTVFSTPDLLIIILSQLPHSSLLKAKLVNKTWASLFGNVEIQASLFKVPRPEGSALYTEVYSDLLMDKFSTFWTVNEEGPDKEVLAESSTAERLHFKEKHRHRQGTTTVELQLPKYPERSHKWQWRELLLCQPAVEALEIVQQINRRAGDTLEYRTVIPRPDGLRMGFLYDAVKYWHEVDGSSVELLWNRKTGDLISSYEYYPDGSSYKTVEEKACVTILGHHTVGCASHGGMTYANCKAARVIKSGDEEVEFFMSSPKTIKIDMGLMWASWEKRKQDTVDHEDEEDEEDEDEEDEDEEDEDEEDEDEEDEDEEDEDEEDEA